MSKPNLIVKEPKESIFKRVYKVLFPAKVVVAAGIKNAKGAFGRKILRNKARKETAYVWGKLGLSAVSAAMIKKSGHIAPRKDRSVRYLGNGEVMKQR
jgi:hypothetical protein